MSDNEGLVAIIAIVGAVVFSVVTAVYSYNVIQSACGG